MWRLTFLLFVVCVVQIAVGEYDLYGPQTFLEWLLHPLSLEEFISSYLYQKPMHLSRGDTKYYNNINLNNVYTEMISQLDTKSKYIDLNNLEGFPQIRALKYNTTFNVEQDLTAFRMDQHKKALSYLSKSQINAIKQYHQSLNYQLGNWDPKSISYSLLNNYTIRFYQTETHSKSTKYLSESYTNNIGFPVRINMYITPKFSKAFAIHHDIEDIFILQIKGSKHWKIYNHSYDYCQLYGYPYDLDQNDKTLNLCQTNIISPWDTYDYKYNIGQYIRNGGINLTDDILEFTLNQGDLIYMPRGYLHEADMFNMDDHDESIHIAMAVYLELYVDYLYNFIKHVFRISKQFRNILKSYVDYKGNPKYLFDNLEIYLRSVSFTDEDLRAALPYFYICDINNYYEYDYVTEKIIYLFAPHFIDFLSFIPMQSAQIKLINKDLRGMMYQLLAIIQSKKMKKKLKKSICAKYIKNKDSFNGVYVWKNEKYQRKYKTISFPMRNTKIRMELANTKTFQ